MHKQVRCSAVSTINLESVISLLDRIQSSQEAAHQLLTTRKNSRRRVPKMGARQVKWGPSTGRPNWFDNNRPCIVIQLLPIQNPYARRSRYDVSVQRDAAQPMVPFLSRMFKSEQSSHSIESEGAMVRRKGDSDTRTVATVVVEP
jgi:hypothetical protein